MKEEGLVATAPAPPVVLSMVPLPRICAVEVTLVFQRLPRHRPPEAAAIKEPFRRLARLIGSPNRGIHAVRRQHLRIRRHIDESPPARRQTGEPPACPMINGGC